MKLCFIACLFVLICRPAFAFNPFQEAGIDQKPGAQVPLDIGFSDETGRRVTLGELGRGKVIVLAPVLHRCPNICGVTLLGLVRAVSAQTFKPERDFVIVALSIDPKERPTDARAALDKLHDADKALPRGSIHGITGSAENVARTMHALGYRYAWDTDIQQFAHVAAVAVLTPQGKLARWLYGVAPDPTDLRLVLTEAGKGRIGGISDQILLLCYHYDPVTGRYGSIIWMALRIAGSCFVALGVGWIAISMYRERRTRRSAA
jgi:protein SCO1/2